MQNTMKINRNVTVGPQPSSDQIKKLREDGFQTVINFRSSGEEKQPLSPDQEQTVVRSAGMDYRHFPVSMESMDSKLVDRFRAEYGQLPKPIFAHCKSGKRSGAMVMMQVACENGMTGEQTLEQAESMGFECDKEALRKFVKDYVDQHSQRTE